MEKERLLLLLLAAVSCTFWASVSAKTGKSRDERVSCGLPHRGLHVNNPLLLHLQDPHMTKWLFATSLRGLSIDPTRVPMLLRTSIPTCAHMLSTHLPAWTSRCHPSNHWVS